MKNSLIEEYEKTINAIAGFEMTPEEKYGRLEGFKAGLLAAEDDLRKAITSGRWIVGLDPAAKPDQTVTMDGLGNVRNLS